MFWKDYLYFTRAQRNGIKALLLLILIIVTIPSLFRRISPVPPHDPGTFQEDIRAFVEMLENPEAGGALAGSAREAWTGSAEGSAAAQDAGPARGAGRGPAGSSAEIRLRPFAFNPNQLSADEWEAMGLPAYVARSILNYREAGGSFRYREDLQRIYLMEEDWFSQLEPYIMLPARKEAESRTGGHLAIAHEGTATEAGAETGAETGAEIGAETGAETGTEADADAGSVAGAASTEVPVHEKSGPADVRPPIDLNRADTTALMEIRGVGSVFSRRIVSYRELLGGFCHPDQLLEVYGMDSVRWQQVKARIMIDTTHIRKMNLNEIPYEELLRHPYIDRNLASSLIGIRDQHGPLKSREQVRMSFLVDEGVYRQIAPYLKAE